MRRTHSKTLNPRVPHTDVWELIFGDVQKVVPQEQTSCRMLHCRGTTEALRQQRKLPESCSLEPSMTHSKAHRIAPGSGIMHSIVHFHHFV